MHRTRRDFLRAAMCAPALTLGACGDDNVPLPLRYRGAVQHVIDQYHVPGVAASVRGALAMALPAQREGRAFVLPEASAGEAALVHDATIYGARTLLAVCAHLAAREPLAAASPSVAASCANACDLADVRGQAHAKRALEIAAAGGSFAVDVRTAGHR